MYEALVFLAQWVLAPYLFISILIFAGLASTEMESSEAALYAFRWPVIVVDFLADVVRWLRS